MNAVEIEEAVSRLAEEPFDAESFPYAFLEAFGNKSTTLQRLRSGNTNQSDIPGAVLQRNNIHILATNEGEVANALAALRSSPATSRQKCKFVLATDGKTLEAENLADGETVACDYAAFSDHFANLPALGQGYLTGPIWFSFSASLPYLDHGNLNYTLALVEVLGCYETQKEIK